MMNESFMKVEPMPQLKSQSLLANADVAVSVGSRPQHERNALKVLAASALVFAATSFGNVHAQDRNASFAGQTDQQVLTVQPDQLVGEVVSVRHISTRSSHRGEISPRSVAGAIIGGLVGHQLGGGNGKTLTTVFGAMAGGSLANRLADRRAGHESYRNAREVEDNDLVTVRVPQSNGFRTYEIVQPAGFELRRGDGVALMTSKDGKNLIAMPIAYEPTDNALSERRRPSPRR